MQDYDIEQMISQGENLSPSESKSIDKEKKYPFISKYLSDNDPDVRNSALSFLEFLNQPWCLPHFLKSMRDPVSTNRALACNGIFLLSLPSSKKLIYDELYYQYGHFQGELTYIEGLILTIGNIGTTDDIPVLLQLLSKEKDQYLSDAYQLALAKLGHEEFVKKIEQTLLFGTPAEKMNTLVKIEYFNRPTWISRVKPLLLDESIAQSYDLGGIQVINRVCDLTINTLRLIDPEKKISFDDRTLTKGPGPYTAEQVTQARIAYGLIVTDEKQQ